MQQNKEQPLQYPMGVTELDFLDMEKDVEVHIDNYFPFETIIKKANRTMAIVRKTYDYMDATTSCLICKSLVRPIPKWEAQNGPHATPSIRKV